MRTCHLKIEVYLDFFGGRAINKERPLMARVQHFILWTLKVLPFHSRYDRKNFFCAWWARGVGKPTIFSFLLWPCAPLPLPAGGMATRWWQDSSMELTNGILLIDIPFNGKALHIVLSDFSSNKMWFFSMEIDLKSLYRDSSESTDARTKGNNNSWIRTLLNGAIIP